MRILHIAIKDLAQIARNKKSALFILILPVLFTWLMGLIFSQNNGSDPRLPVGLADLDGGLAAGYLSSLLEASDTVRPVTMEDTGLDALEEQVRSQETAAVVLIPEGFSARLTGGDSPQLTALVDRNTPTGQAADRAIQLAATRLLGAAQAANLSVEAYGPFPSEAGRQEFFDESLARAISEWQQPRLTVAYEQAGGQATHAAAAYNGNVQSSAGMMVFFATLSMVTTGYLLIAERRSRTLARLLTTPLTRFEVIGGHALAMFLVSLDQTLLLTLFGQWILGVPYWQSPAATILMIVALALFAAGFGLLISALAQNENQVVLLTLGATLGLGLMGGAFFPLDLTGKTFAAIGHLLPSAWAIEGFQNIALRGLGLEAMLLPAGILAAYAAGSFGLAAWRFRFETG